MENLEKYNVLTYNQYLLMFELLDNNNLSIEEILNLEKKFNEIEIEKKILLNNY
jgi:hypothetical protein